MVKKLQLISFSVTMTFLQKPYKHLEEKHEVVHKKWIIPVRFGTKTSKTQYENLPVIWIFSEIPSKKYLVVNPGDWYLLNLQLNGNVHTYSYNCRNERECYPLSW